MVGSGAHFAYNEQTLRLSCNARPLPQRHRAAAHDALRLVHGVLHPRGLKRTGGKREAAGQRSPRSAGCKMQEPRFL